ncbi:hypothetical protein CN902_27465 [Priestia megaterium]|uniref:hypothetical protein n=1 Tax=Priestia megaterium TaxID=1404 RepID=UPI000BFDA354|nr:hypothetical protein [Priestia megaterium]PGK21140.1 hypothetical protein CN902_27465 [Priestia megaterium]
MQDVKFNYLTELCLRYQQHDFYVEEIPLSILSKVDKRFEIPQNEKVIAVLDCTILGSGKSGVCFTDKGLRWRSVGNEVGSIEWMEFSEVNQFKVQNEVEIYFDQKKVFMLGGGSNYPIPLFIELLKTLRDVLKRFSYELLLKQHSISSSVTYNELKNISTLFEKYEEAFEPNNGLLVDKHISTELKKKVIKYFDFHVNKSIVAFLRTFSLKKTDGIVICENGIYLKEAFISLYYPWYVFRNLPLYLLEDELVIGKENVFHLTHSKMKGSEILLFLKKLQKHANSVYQGVPSVIDLYLINSKS